MSYRCVEITPVIVVEEPEGFKRAVGEWIVFQDICLGNI